MNEAKGVRTVLWTALLVFTLSTFLSLTRYMYRVQRLERVYRIVATQNAMLRATGTALATYLTATPDPQELERFVRERMGQVQPGEVPIRVIPEAQVRHDDALAPPLRVRDLPPWYVWWLLFFGPEPPTFVSP